MSTYNGGLNLRQQIDTILCQQNVDVKLKIRDDGSSDSTLKVLEQYRSNSSVELIIGNNVGFGESFMHLLYSSSDKYDYYAFSDQDDIWDSDKLYSGYLMMKDDASPTLYYCSQRIVDERGNFVRNDSSFERICKCSKYSVSKTNLIRGCTMMWNYSMQRQLVEHRPDITKIKEHDVWISWVAFLVGKVVFDDIPHMDYRQSSDNTSPGASVIGRLDILHKFKVMRYIWNNWNGLKSTYAEQLEIVFPGFKLATRNYKKNIKEKLILLFSPKYNKGIPLKWMVLSDLMIIANRL